MGVDQLALTLRAAFQICLPVLLSYPAIKEFVPYSDKGMVSARTLQPHNSFCTHSSEWWLGTELNRRHKDFQSSALPTELPSQPFICKHLYIARREVFDVLLVRFRERR